MSIEGICAVLSCSVVSDSLRPPWTAAPRLLCPWGFSRQEYWYGLPHPPPGDLPNAGIKPRSSSVQVDSWPSVPPGKPKNTGVGSLFFQRIFTTQESNQGLLHCRLILYQLNYQEIPRGNIPHHYKGHMWQTQPICPLMPSLSTDQPTGVSITLDVAYPFTAAPAKCSHCFLP